MGGWAQVRGKAGECRTGAVGTELQRALGDESQSGARCRPSPEARGVRFEEERNFFGARGACGRNENLTDKPTKIPTFRRGPALALPDRTVNLSRISGPAARLARAAQDRLQLLRCGHHVGKFGAVDIALRRELLECSLQPRAALGG